MPLNSFAPPVPPNHKKHKHLTSQELCQHSYNLALFGENSLHLNAYAKVLPLDQILQQARASDERIQNGTPKSLLDGIPVTMKSNIAVGKFWEIPNACYSIFTSLTLVEGEDENYNVTTNNRKGVEEACNIDTTPNNKIYESDIAKLLLKDCGAVLIGITNINEFGVGSLGIKNGLHNPTNIQQGTKKKQTYSPMYNPLQWMRRLS